MEEGCHLKMTEDDLVKWFTDPQLFSTPFTKPEEIEIYENTENAFSFEELSKKAKSQLRTDLVKQIIERRSN